MPENIKAVSDTLISATPTASYSCNGHGNTAGQTVATDDIERDVKPLSTETVSIRGGFSFEVKPCK